MFLKLTDVYKFKKKIFERSQKDNAEIENKPSFVSKAFFKNTPNADWDPFVTLCPLGSRIRWRPKVIVPFLKYFMACVFESEIMMQPHKRPPVLLKNVE